jgi:hypothetical protein
MHGACNGTRYVLIYDAQFTGTLPPQLNDFKDPFQWTHILYNGNITIQVNLNPLAPPIPINYVDSREFIFNPGAPVDYGIFSNFSDKIESLYDCCY